MRDDASSIEGIGGILTVIDTLLRPDLDGGVPRYGCASTQEAVERNCGMDDEGGLVRLPTSQSCSKESLDQGEGLGG
jgi:hypothetical protein